MFQRTANYAVPAWNRQLDPDYVNDIKATYNEFRAANRTMGAAFGSRLPGGHREDACSRCPRRNAAPSSTGVGNYGGLGFLGGFLDVLLTPEANEYVAEYVREKIREQVKDPAVAEAAVRPSR